LIWEGKKGGGGGRLHFPWLKGRGGGHPQKRGGRRNKYQDRISGKKGREKEMEIPRGREKWGRGGVKKKKGGLRLTFITADGKKGE